MKKHFTFKEKSNYLILGITFFLASLPYFDEARKSFNKISNDFMWALIFFIIFIILGMLFVGIYIGIQITEKKVNARLLNHKKT